MLKALFVFLMVTFVDFLKARYVYHTSREEAVRAALYASVATLIYSLVIVSFISDIKMIVPAALGALIGTFISIRAAKKQ